MQKVSACCCMFCWGGGEGRLSEQFCGVALVCMTVIIRRFVQNAVPIATAWVIEV